MDTGYFAGIKQPKRGVDHPPPSSAEVEERVELYLYSPSGPSWPVMGLNFAPCFKRNFNIGIYSICTAFSQVTFSRQVL
jgi:hypothetical protein